MRCSVARFEPDLQLRAMRSVVPIKAISIVDGSGTGSSCPRISPLGNALERRLKYIWPALSAAKAAGIAIREHYDGFRELSEVTKCRIAS